jgi:hypothetical protein
VDAVGRQGRVVGVIELPLPVVPDGRRTPVARQRGVEGGGGGGGGGGYDIGNHLSSLTVQVCVLGQRRALYKPEEIR